MNIVRSCWAALVGLLMVAGQGAKPDPVTQAWERGTAFFNERRWDLAISAYTEAIRLNPRLADAYRARGEAYYYQGDYAKAIADFTESIRVDPKDPRAYWWRGDAYYNRV